MAFDTRAISNFVLDLADRDGDPLSPMKLQKILYFAHGWNLGLGLGALIDDRVEAWKWGPVIPTVYHEFKKFGTDPIVNHRWRRVEVSRRDDGRASVRFVTPSLDECPTPIDVPKAVIEKVWSVYRPFSAVQLSNMTHQPGTPWYITWHEGGAKDRRSTDIPDDLIKQHFEKFLTGAKG